MATASSQWYQVAENAQQQLDAILAQRLVLEERLRAYRAEKGGFIQSSPDWPAFSALGNQISQLQQTVSDAKQKGFQALEAEQKGEEPTPPPATSLKPPADPPPLPADPPPPPPPGPTASAEVKDSNDGATQAPPSPATTTDGRLTTQQAETLAGQTETGTNPPTKPLTETQSVSPNTVSEPSKYTVEDDTSLGTAVSGAATQGQDPTSFYGDPSVDARDNQPGGLPGAGATDDNPNADGQSRATTVRILNAVKNSKFTPRPNVLDQYATYTYSLSWYLMPTVRYNDLVNSGKLSYASYSLLAQSGGAPTQPDAGLGRNEFFGLDYYIDNLEIRSVITGKGSNRAHNTAELQFTITETAGVTLIENLYKAVASVYNRPDFPHASALYCLVIKFYGYDDNGKMVSANSNGAIVEKIIPFKIKNITFAIANKVVEYKVEAVAINYTVGFGSNLGVIKSRIELSGTTIKDLLVSGIPGGEKVSPDDGRQTSPAPPLTDEQRAAVDEALENQANPNGAGVVVSPFQLMP